MKKYFFFAILLLVLPIISAQVKLKSARPDFKLWVYRTLPIDNDNALAIYHTIVPAVFPAPKNSDKDEIDIRHAFTFEQIAKYLSLNKKGALRIFKDKIEYNEIDSLVFNSSVSFDGMYVDCVFKDSDSNKKGNWDEPCTIFDIDNSFIKQHNIHLNNIMQNYDNSLKNSLLQEISKYNDKSDDNDYRFFMPDIDQVKSFTDKDFFKLFYVVIYTMENVPVDDFCMATFYYKNDTEKDYTTSFLFTRKKIAFAGHIKPFFSFTIDNKWYFSCHHQVQFDTGYWGKILFVFENGEFKCLIADYSFAD